MLQANKELRERMRAGHIPIWKLADAIGVSETTAQRMMRKEIAGDKLELMNAAVDKLLKEGEANG